MRDVFGPGSILGYCTNVHAGANAQQLKSNLERFTLAVKAHASPNKPMGVGLWLPANAALQLVQETEAKTLDEWLRKRGLIPFTLNGFPYSDFHQPIVKHAVYRPNWSERDRFEYTIDLSAALAWMLKSGDEGSISTLPLGWPSDFSKPVQQQQAIECLRELADHLHKVYEASGVVIHVDLEPEPGCVIQDSRGVVEFFNLLLNTRMADRIRYHIRVCHDICHASVMFEDQSEMFERYRAAGIRIGKVQISNAIRADLRQLSPPQRVESLAQLKQFSEDRYLHQTMIKSNDELQFFDDLPNALDAHSKSDRAGDEWRVHFHVPVYLESFGLLKTTRDHIVECFRLLKDSEVKHWEVETYAWNVLPHDLQTNDLSDGIAKELLWVRETAKQIHTTT